MITLPSATLPIPRIKKDYGKRVWMCIQRIDAQADPKGYIDTFLRTYRGKLTDVMCISYRETAPYRNLGRSTLSVDYSGRIGNLTILEYLIQQCHKVNMRLQLWVVVSPPALWIGTNSFLKTPMPDDATHHDTSNGGSIVNIHEPSVRDEITAVFADLINCNPGIDGLNLDYIRTDGLVTTTVGADITALVTSIRDAIRPVELSYCCRCGLSDEANKGQSLHDWVGNNIVRTVFIMNYSNSWTYVEESMGEIDDNAKAQIMSGVGAYDSVFSPSMVEGHCYELQRRGFHHAAFFQYSDSFDEAEYQSVLEDYISGRIVDAHTNVTKLEVIPGTSFTFSLNGVDKTTNFADVADHTTTETLQAHVEDAYGRQPFITCRRNTTTTVNLIGRDLDSYFQTG